MISVRNLIVFSTFPALFSSAMYFVVGGVHIQLFYFFMVFNLGLMLYLGRAWVPRGLLLLIALVFVSGAMGIAQASDTVSLVAKELTGISVSALYFCCFMRLTNYDVNWCFRKYAVASYYVAIIGLILLPLQFIVFGLTRLQSVLSEPSMFATTCLPALYYFADQWQRHRRDGIKLLVMAAAFLLAGSSVGFLGIMFGIVVFGFRYKRGMALIPVAVALLGVAIYALSADFRLRLNDTAKSSQSLDVSDANLSTFALIANVYVTMESFRDHPVFGTGVGSHVLSYEKIIETLPGVDQWADSPLMKINATDASSLFLRTLSEFGLVGILLVFWFIWHYRARGGQGIEVVSQAIWIYFFAKLLRGGVYFSPEQFFFIVLYAVNGRPQRSPELGYLAVRNG
jgi:O-Antigen ligase